MHSLLLPNLKNQSQFNRKVRLKVRVKKLAEDLEHDTAKV